MRADDGSGVFRIRLHFTDPARDFITVACLLDGLPHRSPRGAILSIAVDHQKAYAKNLINRLRAFIGESLANSLLNTDQSTNEGINIQRELVAALKARIEHVDGEAFGG